MFWQYLAIGAITPQTTSKSTEFVAYLISILGIIGLSNLIYVWMQLRNNGTAVSDIWGSVEANFEAIAQDGGSPDVRLLVDGPVDAVAGRIVLSRIVANYAVYLGLLGTLFGLALSVGQLQGVGGPSNDPTKFAEAASDTLRGFRGAFGAAIAGVFVTVTLGTLNALFDRHLDAIAGRTEQRVFQDLIRNRRAVETTDPNSPAAALRQAVASIQSGLNLVFADASRRSDELTKVWFEASRRLADETSASLDSMGKANARLSGVVESAANVLQASERNSHAAAELTREAMTVIQKLSAARDLDKQVETLSSILDRLTDVVTQAPNSLSGVSQQLVIASTALNRASESVAPVLASQAAQEARFRQMISEEFKRFESRQADVYEALDRTLQKHHEYATQVVGVVAGFPEGPELAKPAPAPVHVHIDPRVSAQIEALVNRIDRLATVVERSRSVESSRAELRKETSAKVTPKVRKAIPLSTSENAGKTGFRETARTMIQSLLGRKPKQ